jgi:hypothetical protein
VHSGAPPELKVEEKIEEQSSIVSGAPPETEPQPEAATTPEELSGTRTEAKAEGSADQGPGETPPSLEQEKVAGVNVIGLILSLSAGQNKQECLSLMSCFQARVTFEINP